MESEPDKSAVSGVKKRRSPRINRLLLCAFIFLLALGVRLLTWHDTRLEVGKVQSGVTADYQRVAQLLREGGIKSFLSSSSPLADPNNLGHPPGYPILVALTQTVFGQSDTAVQFVQMIADAVSAVVIFLIVAELFSPLPAGIAGALAAFSPQFAWNSVLLLPDTLAVLPILLAAYFLVRAMKHPRLITFIIIGALIGISCWLRANAMLMAVFFAVAAPLLIKGPTVWRYAGAIVVGTILIIAPITIRNAIVFHRFIPISLGAGQTLLEGIADYDPQRRFGIPPTDVEIQQQEAEAYHQPEYSRALFNPDGIERERARLSRGFAVIRSHPLWFAGVMARRASTMVRLERARRVSTEPPFPRIVIHGVQRALITAVILPLAIIGLLVVVFRKQSAALVILSVVPVYYFTVQSMVHTEYRYVLAALYFLFAFAAVGIGWIGSWIGKRNKALPYGRSTAPASFQSTR